MSKDQTILFHSTVFGPIHSRRLGTSLGVNLSPADGKVCSFDCLYCEAGFNSQGPGKAGLPTREATEKQLRAKLEQMKADGQTLDVITFSGNGEPTLNPEFPQILDDTIRLRDEYFPNARVSVLCNSTRLDNPAVVAALKKADNNILKLDSAVEATMRLIDRPNQKNFTVAKLLPELEAIGSNCIIQTMMLRGEYEGQKVDNTTEEEIKALEDAYRRIKPREVMLYSIDRATPAEQLQKVPIEELRAIGKRIEQETGVPVQVN
ncbi:MAG: radical SAM protein [Muribaculaceae bacterium]|nr:radical SAM protein [Muribaculaceae bacterium]